MTATTISGLPQTITCEVAAEKASPAAASRRPSPSAIGIRPESAVEPASGRVAMGT